MDLRRHAVRPGGQRELQRLAVRDVLGVVAVVVQDVPHDGQPRPLVEAEHVAQRERAVVVLDAQAGAAALADPREAVLEAVERGLRPARSAADVQHHDGLGPTAHAVEQCRHHVHLAGRQRPHVLALGVQHHVLPGVERQPDVELARPLPDRGQLLGALGDLVVEPGKVRVRRVGRQVARHAVHPHVDRVEALEDRGQPVERHGQVRARLPAACVVGGKAALTEDLHRESEAVHSDKVLPR